MPSAPPPLSADHETPGEAGRQQEHPEPHAVTLPEVDAGSLMLVPVAVVGGVPASVVDVVDVVAVRDGHVAASVTVLVWMVLVSPMTRFFAFVDVSGMWSVQMPVVGVVDVVAVRDGNVTASRPVPVIVAAVLVVLGHGGKPPGSVLPGTGAHE